MEADEINYPREFTGAPPQFFGRVRILIERRRTGMIGSGDNVSLRGQGGCQPGEISPASVVAM